MPGPVVFRPDVEVFGGFVKAQIDAAAFGSIADGVVGKGFDEGVDFRCHRRGFGSRFRRRRRCLDLGQRQPVWSSPKTRRNWFTAG